MAVFKGVGLDEDDKLRRAVITQLICHFSLKFSVIEQQFDVVFSDYFSTELNNLKNMQRDGLLIVTEQGINVESAGRLLIRNVCMVFDIYLSQKQQQFSKVI